MSEAEAQAKAQGWTPKEEFTGDPGKWRSAEEFLDVGNKISAVQADNNRKLLEKVESLEGVVRNQSETFDSFQKQQFKVIGEANKAGYNKAVKDIEKKQRVAVEDGDVAAFDALEKEKKGIEKPKAVAPVETKPAEDPEFKAWHKENSWYKVGSPDEISMAADSYGGILLSRRPDLTGPAYYKEVEKHIKTVFPDSFKAPESKIETGGRNNTPTGKTGYKDLPKDAKEACDMFVKQGMMTKEDYTKEYFEANGVE